MGRAALDSLQLTALQPTINILRFGGIAHNVREEIALPAHGLLLPQPAAVVHGALAALEHARVVGHAAD